MKVIGKVGQQAHDDELGGTDAESSYGQRHQRRMEQDVLALRRRFWTRFKAWHSFIPTYLLSMRVKTKKLLGCPGLGVAGSW